MCAPNPIGLFNTITKNNRYNSHSKILVDVQRRGQKREREREAQIQTDRQTDRENESGSPIVSYNRIHDSVTIHQVLFTLFM